MFIETLLKSARAKRLIRDKDYDERLSYLLAHGKLSLAYRTYLEILQIRTHYAQELQARLAEMQRICAVPTDRLPFKKIEQPIDEEEEELLTEISSMPTLTLPAMPKHLREQFIGEQDEPGRDTDPLATRNLRTVETEKRATVKHE